MVVGALLTAAVAAAPVLRKEVTSLPGLAGDLPSKMYTGFLPAGTPPSGNGTMYFHYWLQEAEVNASTAPVMVWYNGGPGASSLFGMLTELGPLLLNEGSMGAEYNRTGVPQLQRNDFAWTKYASVVAIDSPPPVGFSFCSEAGQTGGGGSCGDWTDELVAEANRKALGAFFADAFPEFEGRDFYIAGESYAGVYVPLLTDQFMRNPLPASGPKFRGIAVGDGCTGKEGICGLEVKQLYYLAAFLHGHGQTPEAQWEKLRSACPNGAESAVRPACLARCGEVIASGGGWYQYDLYDDCPYSHGFAAPRRRAVGSKVSPVAGVGVTPCPGDAMQLWLERADVRAALGLAPGANFFNVDGSWPQYKSTVGTVLPIYKKAVDAGLRVMIYNGDTDPAINSMLAQDVHFAALKEEGVRETAAWRAWTLDGVKRMGGFVTEFAGGSLWFTTIRGAGHMVPEIKPAAAAVMISSFLAAESLPRWRPLAPPPMAPWLREMLNATRV
eukprot:TRINITY_DN30652_c0_g1_i1.p1 TRINITY_DN30652_c0_g1~~TRINITY_DN30652_c0_g1_i1.p1  ORF type:complete len:499 (+),score=176.12 TRINITY_DN30652_c0_g1_i1:75-1571(+)